MKFYSEKLNALYDSPEELERAEADVATKKKSRKATQTEAEKMTKNTEKVVAEEPKVPTKKQLAAEVEAADIAVKDAYAAYEAAKGAAEELSKKYLAELDAILDPAEKAVKEAEQRRYEAIRNFNDTYGAYQVTYTGSRASDELFKAINSMNDRANRLFKLFW